VDPDMGAWRYGYYPSGSLSWQVDARNCQTSLSYDAGDRLTGKSYAGTCSGAQPVTYGYLRHEVFQSIVLQEKS
jgi:hypothetical protein